MCQVGVDNTGVPYFLVGDGTLGEPTYKAPAQYAFRAGIWYRLELKVTLATAATGSFEMRVNGVSVLTQSTIVTARAHAQLMFSLYSGAGGAEAWHDDVYVCDTTGAVNNDFLGDIMVVDETPNQDGIYQEWTPLSGTDHFAMVDEIPPDGNTSYVSDGTIGHRDTYKYPSTGVPAGSQLVALQVNIDAEKDVAGTRIIAPLVRQAGAGADFVGTDISLSQDPAYAIFHQVFDVNPVSGAAWAVADLTAAEFGQQVTG